MISHPQFESAEQVYCTPCKTRTPHIKIVQPPSTYATSKCLLCNPELLDAHDHGTPFRFECFDRWELRRLIRVRDRNLGKGLRAYLRAGASPDLRALVSLERED